MTSYLLMNINELGAMAVSLKQAYCIKENLTEICDQEVQSGKKNPVPRFIIYRLLLPVYFQAGYKTRSWSWSWSFTRSRTSTAPFYRTPPLIGCLDTATAPNIDLGVQLPAFDNQHDAK